MSSTPKILLSAGLLLSVVLVAGTAVNAQRLAAPRNIEAISSVAQVNLPSDPEKRVIGVVKNANPAVVSVIITKNVRNIQQFQEGPSGGSRDFFMQLPRRSPATENNGAQVQEVGGGTAFFVSSDGLLITNKHVIDDPQADYTVLLNDGRKLHVDIAARDPSNDIALLRVSGGNFPFLHVDTTDSLELGQTAIAIGNALGEYRNTVSVGVVSGLSRSIMAANPSLSSGVEQLSQIIQTDAAINEGNSGGPLLNSDGDVIGMNTAVSSVGQNIGFAIPAVELRRVLQSYQKNGRIVRAHLGVRYLQITPDLKQQENLPYDYGDLVSTDPNDPTSPAVLPGSPADKAGIQEGDIILEADGKRLGVDQTLTDLIQGKLPGDTLNLRIYHNGQTKNVTVTLTERPGA